MTDRTPSLRRTLLALVLPLLTAAACGDDGATPPPDEAGTIARETFVEVYVDLRIAALRSEGRTIDAATRERILSRHDVTRDDLLEFVDVHGENPRFIRDVWGEVEARIDSIRNPEDTTST